MLCHSAASQSCWILMKTQVAPWRVLWKNSVNSQPPEVMHLNINIKKHMECRNGNLQNLTMQILWEWERPHPTPRSNLQLWVAESLYPDAAELSQQCTIADGTGTVLRRNSRVLLCGQIKITCVVSQGWYGAKLTPESRLQWMTDCMRDLI